MSASSYLLPGFPAMRVVWAAPVLIWTTFMGLSSLSEGCTQGADNVTRWRKLDGAWSGSPTPTVASWAASSA
jgi:hypothetical protein